MKMRREFEDRRIETGAKKEPRGMAWEEDRRVLCEGSSRGDGSGQSLPGWRAPAAPGRRCWMGVLALKRELPCLQRHPSPWTPDLSKALTRKTAQQTASFRPHSSLRNLHLLTQVEAKTTHARHSFPGLTDIRWSSLRGVVLSEGKGKPSW